MRSIARRRGRGHAPIPDRTIAGGVPARVLRHREPRLDERSGVTCAFSSSLIACPTRPIAAIDSARITCSASLRRSARGRARVARARRRGSRRTSMRCARSCRTSRRCGCRGSATTLSGALRAARRHAADPRAARCAGNDRRACSEICATRAARRRARVLLGHGAVRDGAAARSAFRACSISSTSTRRSGATWPPRAGAPLVVDLSARGRHAWARSKRAPPSARVASLVVNEREAEIARDAGARRANVQVLANGVELERLRPAGPPARIGRASSSAAS